MFSRFFSRSAPIAEVGLEGGGTVARWLAGGATAIAVVIFALSLYWEVDRPIFGARRFDVREVAVKRAGDGAGKLATGYMTTSTLIEVASFLLDKPGGFLANDVTPPGILMDNTPNWEFGVVVQLRDLTRVLRNDFSRSQSQSTEDPDLQLADPSFHNDSEAWLFPSFEGQVNTGIDGLQRYLARLQASGEGDARFFARADNLAEYLTMVARRLGDHSQRLSASVGQVRIDTRIPTAPVIEAPAEGAATLDQTPWLEIDDVFYEARGATWALLHFLRAIENDFEGVLERKNALVSMRQIIRALEQTQAPLYSPMVLNGTGFALFANHSLVMASYISGANAAAIDLIRLLQQG